jgi:L-threonylcarbamoyladenylate synthase
MTTRILPAERPESIEEAAHLLESGGLVAFPTDTVYGLAASLTRPQAIEALFEAKGRDTAKAIAVLVGRRQDLEQVAGPIGPVAARLAERFWPGALTLVVPVRPGLPPNLSPRPTIGVRMPDHPAALALLIRTGPLAVTSANRSGGPDCSTVEEVLAQLGGRIDLILDGGRTPGGTPSTVVDCTGEQPLILRSGPVTEAMIRQAL